MTDRHEIDVARQRTNRRVCFIERIKKSIRIRSFGSERSHAERMRRIELRKRLPGCIELFNGKHECAEHPTVARTNILPLMLQGRLERKTARREHTGVIKRCRKESLKRNGGA